MLRSFALPLAACLSACTPSERVLRVAAEAAPLLAEAREGAPARETLHAGELLLPGEGPGATLAWRGALEGRDASRDGELVAVRRSGAEPEADSAAGLPASYLPDAKQRIEIHRRLAQVATPGDLRQLRSELRDRFGPPPVRVELLLEVVELRFFAAAAGITCVETRAERLSPDGLAVGAVQAEYDALAPFRPLYEDIIPLDCDRAVAFAKIRDRPDDRRAFGGPRFQQPGISR